MMLHSCVESWGFQFALVSQANLVVYLALVAGFLSIEKKSVTEDKGTRQTQTEKEPEYF